MLSFRVLRNAAAVFMSCAVSASIASIYLAAVTYAEGATERSDFAPAISLAAASGLFSVVAACCFGATDDEQHTDVQDELIEFP